MELIIFAILGAIQGIVSFPAPEIYSNNEINKDSYSKYAKYYDYPLYSKTSWPSSYKKTYPSKTVAESINEIDKLFPFNLNSPSPSYNNQQEYWNKKFKYDVDEKNEPNEIKIIQIEDEKIEDEDEYSDIPILSEDDLDDRLGPPSHPIDPALMCSLLGRCFEDQY